MTISPNVTHDPSDLGILACVTLALPTIDCTNSLSTGISPYFSGRSYKEAVEEKFISCDTDFDDKLDAREFIQCIVKNDSMELVNDKGREHIVR